LNASIELAGNYLIFFYLLKMAWLAISSALACKSGQVQNRGLTALTCSLITKVYRILFVDRILPILLLITNKWSFCQIFRVKYVKIYIQSMSTHTCNSARVHTKSWELRSSPHKRWGALVFSKSSEYCSPPKKFGAMVRSSPHFLGAFLQFM